MWRREHTPDDPGASCARYGAPMGRARAFADRVEAGRRVAEALPSLEGDVLVLGLARGGVPVAAEVADALGAPLDLLFVRKIGAPHHPELGLGAVVDGKRVQELPIPHGNPYFLIGLAAGVSFTRDPRLDRPFEPTHIVGYTMDGTRANRSDVTIDGAVATATANAGEVTASYVPPADLVQEFKVQTATFDASFGQTEGGVTNIALKLLRQLVKHGVEQMAALMSFLTENCCKGMPQECLTVVETALGLVVAYVMRSRAGRRSNPPRTVPTACGS